MSGLHKIPVDILCIDNNRYEILNIIIVYLFISTNSKYKRPLVYLVGQMHKISGNFVDIRQSVKTTEQKKKEVKTPLQKVN